MGELLFEIGTEEIPAGYIDPALLYLEQAAAKHLSELKLEYGKIRTLGTPRRLTLVVEKLQDHQQDRVVEHIGPSKQAGYDAGGNPSKAARGFARSRGVAVEDLKVIETAKGEYLMAVEHITGEDTLELLPATLTRLVKEMPFPKSMRWGSGTLTFARPIQWLTALFGGNLIDLSIDGITADRTTVGHRFMATGPFTVRDSGSYLRQLKENLVMVDPGERRSAVIEQVVAAARDHKGEPLLDEELVATVTNLVEIPWGVCGSFDEKFLELPSEVLITSMREHQKYFPVAGDDGRLLPLFVAVNNTRVEDRELAVSGHQRVLRARLEDALFFFREDRKTKLADRQLNLQGIVFQKQLGTMLEKTKRIEALAGVLADRIDPALKSDVRRASQLAKCDLLTEMVGEFPSLQGVMGMEYARIDGEPEAVAVAIHEHYKPVRAGSALPDGLAGAIVGMADRLDTLAGCFAIGEKPTGTTDPFGLRRQALGLLHIILGHSLHLSLPELIDGALAGYRGFLAVPPEASLQLHEFVRLRFENDVIAGGTPTEIVNAATSVDFSDVVDCMARIEALRNISNREQFSVLAGSYKRIRNIIKDNRDASVKEVLLQENAEQKLYETMREVRAEVEPLVEQGRYDAALEAVLQVKEPVDDFFDKVMVMVDDPELRQNRLNLLTALGEMVLRVGDISKMHRE